MARNSGGTHSLPAGNPVVTATTITSTWANDTLNDISTEVTDSLCRSGKGAMLAALELYDGTSAAPGLSFDSEANTGLYRAGAADIRLSIAGTDRAKATATSWFYDMLTALTAVGLSIKGAVADGAAAIGVKITNTTTLSTSGAKIAAFYPDNGTTDKLSVDKDGALLAASAGASLTAKGTVANGGSAVGIVLDNTVSLTTAGAKIVSVCNATAEKAYFNKDGALNTSATESGTIAAGTGWTASISILRKSAGMVFAHFVAAAGGTATTSICTLPEGFRPISAMSRQTNCVINDDGVGDFPAVVSVGTNGVVTLVYYDNGTSYAAFTPGNLDDIEFTLSFAMI